MSWNGKGRQKSPKPSLFWKPFQARFNDDMHFDTQTATTKSSQRQTSQLRVCKPRYVEFPGYCGMLLLLPPGYLMPSPFLGIPQGCWAPRERSKSVCKVILKLVQPAVTGLCTKVAALLLSLIVICYFSVEPPIRQDLFSWKKDEISAYSPKLELHT